MRLRLWTLTACGLVAACIAGTTDPLQDEEPVAVGWQTFSIAQMRDQQARQGTSYYQAMADSAFRLGLFNRPIGIPMNVASHPENVVYYVANGSAVLSTDSADFTLEAGQVYFVKGGYSHRFRSVTSELDVVVVFTSGVPAPQDPDIAAFSMDEMVTERHPERSVWTPLLQTSSLGVGMYMLPKGLGDEPSLTHTFDEFKMVVRGGGRFDLGTGGIEASEGSIAFIEQDLGHRFRRVSDDLDVLVIWAR